MTFKEWLKLQEVGTSSSSIASFKPIVGYSNRHEIPMLQVKDDEEEEECPKPKKKNKD